MSALRERLAREQRVVIQGITGRTARGQLPVLRASGTNIVAGVVPGRTGDVDGVPLFSSLAEARSATGCNVSIVVVPPSEVRAACIEAAECGLDLVVVLTEGVPVLDALAIRSASRETMFVGANTPGMAIAGVIKLGFMPSRLLRAGNVGLVSRSGTLSYEVALGLSDEGLGVSTWIGTGGDPVPLLDMAGAARLVLDDPETRALVVIGEIGGDGEERIADAMAAEAWRLPVHALVVGESIAPDRPMGHAGAMVRGDVGAYGSKVRRLTEAGVHVHATPWELASAVSAGVAQRT